MRASHTVMNFDDVVHSFTSNFGAVRGTAALPDGRSSSFALVGAAYLPYLRGLAAFRAT